MIPGDVVSRISTDELSLDGALAIIEEEAKIAYRGGIGGAFNELIASLIDGFDHFDKLQLLAFGRLLTHHRRSSVADENRSYLGDFMLFLDGSPTRTAVVFGIMSEVATPMNWVVICSALFTLVSIEPTSKEKIKVLLQARQVSVGRLTADEMLLVESIAGLELLDEGQVRARQQARIQNRAATLNRYHP